MTSKHSLDIAIISLKEHITRRKNIMSQIKNQGHLSRVSDAINGKEMSAHEYFCSYKCEASKINGRKFLTPSELGCFLSHKKVINEFLASKNDWLLVLEDDVNLINDLNKLTNKFENLDHNSIYILGGQDGLSSFKKVLFKNQRNGTKKIIFGTHRWIYRTCCYLIHKKAANNIFTLMNKYNFMADDWGFILKKTDIERIYYEEYFAHPIDITDSVIETERKLAK
ncbi:MULTISPECIES: glycosyltransferase family 25 protein [unclassified Providencia]|uniref:glycosyltransferase family 25 protein n=1 Tax=unclassified Providencia TaxID=2633465 RepID=UPI002348EF70|nr:MULTISPECIES: glycosyltransferase family 25 protein [unclassified Providencia]